MGMSAQPGPKTDQPELSRHSNSTWIPGPVMDRILHALEKATEDGWTWQDRDDARRLLDELEEATR